MVFFMGAIMFAVTSSAGPKASKLVRDLSWESVHGECNGLTWRIEPQGRAASRLLEVGQPATGDLVDALLDPDRAVPAHLILCRIWSREAACATRSTATVEPMAEPRVGEQLDINAIHEFEVGYASGALEWRSSAGGRYSVVTSTLEANLGWWCGYLPEDTLRLTSACSSRRARLRSELGQSVDGRAPVAADAQR